MMAAVFPLSDGTLAYEIIGSSRGAAPPGTGKCHRVTLAPSHYLFRSFSLYRPMPASPSPQPRALVFDLDGTLVDSVPDLAEALNRVLAMRGRDTLSRSAVRSMVGDGVPKLVERGFAATGGAPDDLPAQIETFPGIYEKAATGHTDRTST